MTHTIEFTLYNDRGVVIKKAKMLVKNSISPMHAKLKLEKHLSYAFSDYHRLVIHSNVVVVEKVKKEPKYDAFSKDIESLFGDIFKTKK